MTNITIQHFTGTPVSVVAGGTWRVRCTCGWSADAAFRSEAFDLGYIHEDGGWAVAGTPTTYEEGVALVYAGVRTRIEHGGPDCWRIEAAIEDNR